MADTESQLEAGRRLARDLRSIRRSRSIDLKEVLDATRLADDVIEQLEETALMGNPMFNRVYLRSMFSSYASVLGIAGPDMMSALEEAMSGHYIGSLAKKYLGESGGEEPDEAEDAFPEPALGDETPTPADKADRPGHPDRSEADDAPSSEDEDQEDEPETEGGESESPSQAILAEPESALDESVPTPSGPASASPAAAPFTGPAAGIGSYPSVQKARFLLPNMSGFLMLVFAGIALIAMIWFAVSWLLSPKTEAEEQLVTQDSTAISMVERPERIVLADTLSVDLIAFVEALDPIRIKVDRDLRRPYWIEHLDTLSFTMTNTVEFEREVDHARILISGFVIPTSWYNNEIRAEITREKTQAWLDSLTQAGVFPPRSSQ